MVKKKKEEIEIEEIKAPIPPISPLLSNVVAVFSCLEVVMLDFGFVAPDYRKPYGIEDSQVARICLPWDSAENLLESLNDVISDYKKEQKSKRKSRK